MGRAEEEACIERGEGGGTDGQSGGQKEELPDGSRVSGAYTSMQGVFPLVA
jgi:hypothetical protein